MGNDLSPKQRSAIERAKRHPELQPLLFAKAEGVKWLVPFIEAGFLDPQLIPSPRPAPEPGYSVVPAWPVIDYVARIGDEFQDDPESAAQVVGLLRAVTSYAKQNNISNYRVWDAFAKILTKLPPSVFNPTDADMVDYWLDDKFDRGLTAEGIARWMAKLLKTKNDELHPLLLALFGRLYAVDFIDETDPLSTRKKARLRVDSWHARKVNGYVCSLAGATLGPPIVNFFESLLHKTIRVLQNDSWTSVWRPAIEEHQQNAGRDDTEHVLVEAFRDSVLGLAGSTHDPTECVREILTAETLTVARVGVYSLNISFGKLSQLLEVILDKKYFSVHFRHEVWHLLYQRYADFGLAQQQRVLAIIEDELGREESTPHSLAYERACWLAAIKRFSPQLNLKYETAVIDAGTVPDHPDFSAYMTSGWVEDVSPISPSDLQALSAAVLVETLNRFKPSGAWSFNAPSVRGLSKALRASLTAYPARLIEDCDTLSQLDLPYVYEILEGFTDLWKERPGLSWEQLWPALIKFCDQVTAREGFWDPVVEGTEFVANRYWVVGAVARLIEAGCRSDGHSFAPELVPPAQALLLRLLDGERGEEFKESSDAVHIAINSPRGRALEAFINLALRECRLSDSRTGEHRQVWNRLQLRFDDELGRVDQAEYEFVTLAGSYLPNFMYMSLDWTLERLPFIFHKSNYLAWLCAMQGYSYVPATDKRIYEYLADGGDLIRALDDPHIADKVSRSVVQRITVAYLNNVENLSDPNSRISTLIDRLREDELSEVIWLVWTLRPGTQSQGGVEKERVFAMWSAILDRLDIATPSGKKIASRLCEWLVFVDQITDENRARIHKTVQCAAYSYNTHHVIEAVARFSEKQPEEAADLWLRMLSNSSADLPDEAMRTAFANLIGHGDFGIKLAKRIADSYLVKGNGTAHQVLQELLRPSS